jgi:hypothetical protein
MVVAELGGPEHGIGLIGFEVPTPNCFVFSPKAVDG